MRRPSPIVLGIAAMAVAVSAAAAPSAPADGDGRLWYLSCTGDGGGDGSLEAPFGRAARAVVNAAAGDSIVVLPVDDPAPECVVELANGQRLMGAGVMPRPRLTRVVTAASTVVADLEIVGSEREALAITGGEVTIRDVVIRDAVLGVLVDGGDVRVVMERVTIDGSTADAILVRSRGRGATEVSLRECTVTGSGNDGLGVVADDDAAVVMKVVDSRFEDIAGQPCRLTVHDEAAVDATLERTEMSDVGFGVVAFVEAGGALDLQVDNLVATGVEVTGVNLVLDATSTPRARVSAVISGGRIAKTGGSGHGVRLTASGSGTMTARIEGLAVNGGVEYDRGISAEAREGASRLDVVLVGNRVEVGPAALEGIMVRARDEATVCAQLRDNVVHGGSVGIALGHRDGGRLELAADRDDDVDAATVEALVRTANRAASGVAVRTEAPVRLVTGCGDALRGDGG